MTVVPLTAVTASLIEKVAADNGFDLGPVPDGAWLRFGSTQCALRVALGAAADGGFFAALSRRNVADELGSLGSRATAAMPAEAVAMLQVATLADLHRLLRRAFQLARTLPNELLHEFERVAAALPRTTEAERLVVQRVGQDLFRRGLLEFWEGQCAITGLAVPELLRASHAKPWADCASDAERLDVHNGLLLAPHLDAAFDRGFLTITSDGQVMSASSLDAESSRLLGLDRVLRVRQLAAKHGPYLQWHRERVFRSR